MASFSPVPSHPPYPKIAALLDADTPLGRRLFQNLLLSPDIHLVHLLTTAPPPHLPHLPLPTQRKAAIHLLDFDNLDLSLSALREADYAFCLAAAPRHTVSSPRLHDLNYRAPSHFVRAMFHLGVLHLSVLTHLQPVSHSANDFHHPTPHLPDFVRKLVKEAAEYAPFLSLFKIPTPLPRSSPRHFSELPLNDLATAMQYNAFSTALLRKAPGTDRRKLQFEELYERDVYRLSLEADQNNWPPSSPSTQ